MTLTFDDEHRIAPSRTREDGWTYHLIRAQTPADDFGDFSGIVDLWQGKFYDGVPPGWNDFTADELTPWWDWMTVIDLIPGDELDGQFRYYGPKVQELLAQDLTGKTLRTGPLPGGNSAGYTTHDFLFLTALIKRPCIGVATGSVAWQQGRDNIYFTTIRLPLADENDEIVTILSTVQIEK